MVFGIKISRTKQKTVQKQKQKEKPKMSEAAPPKEVKPTTLLKRQIVGRMTRVKQVAKEDGTIDFLRVTIRTFKVGKAKSVFPMKTGIKGMESMAYFTDLSCLDAKDELTWDVNYAEPIDPALGVPRKSLALSMMMANAFVTQGIEVATLLGGFIFKKRHIIFMSIAAIFAGMFVLTMDQVFHFVPLTEIHWVRSLPHR